MIAAIFAVLLAAGQHVYTNADVENGARLYSAGCATCHGPRGDAVRGVALFGGSFRRATTDDEVARIVLNGIPGTSMPPNKYSETEAGMIVAYLRGAARGGVTTTTGDATRGRAIFSGKGRCATCHNETSRMAPSLDDVGIVRRPLEIEQALVDPNADVNYDYRFVRAVTRNGETITGRLLNQSSFSVQILDGDARLRSFDRSDLKEFAIKTTSEMPSYRSELDSQEIADLVTYLVTLRGRR